MSVNRLRQLVLSLALLAGCSPVPDDLSKPTNVWLEATPLSFSRQNVPGVALNGRILLLGGLANPNGYRWVIRDVSVYDPETDAWSPGTPMPIARAHASVAVVGNRLYVTGGFTGSGFASSRVFIYDAAADAWEQASRMPTRRGGLATIALNGLVYAIGGGNDRDGQVATNEVYDPVTGEWSTLPSMPTSRDRMGATVHEDEIYTFGGRRDGVALDAVEIFDPDANRWRSADPMPVPLSGSAAVSLGSRIYLFGGIPIGSDPAVEVRSEVWRYHPGSDEWDVLPSNMPTPRQSMAAIVYQDRIYLIGGGVGSGGFEPSSANEVFVP